MLGLGLDLGLRPQIAGLGLESHGLGGCGLGLGLDMCGLVNITGLHMLPVLQQLGDAYGL